MTFLILWVLLENLHNNTNLSGRSENNSPKFSREFSLLDVLEVVCILIIKAICRDWGEEGFEGARTETKNAEFNSLNFAGAEVPSCGADVSL